MSGKRPRPAKLTGRHAAAMLVAFFAVVIIVNLIMARFAISTFGGTVVDNSYVASQKYNGWLKKAREEKAHGWQISKTVREGDHIALRAADSIGKPLTGATVTMTAEHPLGRARTLRPKMKEIAPGHYRSSTPLPSGRWKLKIKIALQGREFNLVQDI